MSLANTCAAVWLVVRRLPEQKDCSALWMCVSLWAAACRASIVWLCLFDTPQIDAVHSDAPEKKKKKNSNCQHAAISLPRLVFDPVGFVPILMRIVNASLYEKKTKQAALV